MNETFEAMTRRRFLFLSAATAITVVAAACGRLNGGGGGGGIAHPTGAGDLILRVDTGGGFVPQEYLLKDLPEWSLMGDGRVITQGPQIEIYPGPALPNLLQQQLNEDAVQEILRAAEDAGLFGPDADYGYPCVMDAGTTTFTLNERGRTHVISAYALGLDAGECPDVDTEARDRLARFSNRLFDLASWLPAGSVGEEEPFAFDELRIHVQAYAGRDDELEQTPQEWPLGTPLAGFGDIGGPVPDTRCGTVSGTDLETLMPLLRSANELTPWTSGGDRYRLILRPLLPDESGC